VRIKLLVAAFCMLALPFVFSHSRSDKHGNSAPYNTVAFAGHVFGSGIACGCGCPNCICEPGEQARECNRAHELTVNRTGANDGQVDTSVSAPASDFNFGAGAMLFALAMFAWFRFRA
jgi:hypothetical protein